MLTLLSTINILDMVSPSWSSFNLTDPELCTKVIIARKGLHRVFELKLDYMQGSLDDLLADSKIISQKDLNI